MKKSAKKQKVNYFSEAVFFDPEVESVDSLVGSVGPEIKVVPASPGKVSFQIPELLASGASTLHFLGHGKPGQIELAGFVLDSSAWESIVGDLESPDAHDNREFGSGDPVSGEMEEKAASAASHVVDTQKLEINFLVLRNGRRHHG